MEKTIEDFIDEHRDELITAIRNQCSNCPTSDEDIEEWISNDESLYNWALDEGVDV